MKLKPPVVLRRLRIIGTVAIVCSVLVNIIISLIARNWLHLPATFAPLGIGPIIFWSVIFGIGAVTVFAALKRWSARPLQTYIFLSIAVYICTFLPDAWLLSATPPPFPGVTPAAVITLMSMHAAEAIILLGTFCLRELLQG